MMARPDRVTGIGTAMIEAADVLASPATRPGGGFAMTRRRADVGADEHHHQVEIWIDDDVRVVDGNGGDTAPRWSPDGRRLSLHRRVEGVAQVVEVGDGTELVGGPDGDGVPAGGTRQLTFLRHGVTDHGWSPDGRRLAVLAAVAASDPSAVGAPPPAWRNRPIEVRGQLHKFDGMGLRRDLCPSLFVVDVATGEATPVVVGTHQVQTMAWSPDGRRLAFTTVEQATPGRSPTMPLWVVDVGGGRPERLATSLEAVGAIAWSRHGLAVVGHRRPGAGAFGRLFLVDPDDPAAAPVEPFADQDASVGGAPLATVGTPPGWLADGRLAWTRARGGVHEVVVGDPATGQCRVVAGGGLESAPRHDVAGRHLTVVRQGADDFDQVLHGDVDAGLAPVTPRIPRPTVVPPLGLQAVEFDVDGATVPGWLARPAGDGPHPMLLDVHGGPHGMWAPTLSEVTWYRHALVELGWAVLALNPVGSDGYGERHATGAVGGWGFADGAQWLAVVDQLVRDGVADPDRLAVTGFSYGGYMTNWLAATTDRFRAAVAGSCISDLVSFAGTADLGPMFLHAELGCELLEDQERYRRHSPLHRAADLTTPLLLLHGEADLRTPLGQAEQLFAALHRVGRRVELVIYPGADHALRKDGRPAHRLDYGRRLVAWLEQHTHGEPPEELAPQRSELDAQRTSSRD